MGGGSGGGAGDGRRGLETTAGPEEPISGLSTFKKGVARYDTLEFIDNMVDKVVKYVVDVAVDSMGAKVANDMAEDMSRGQQFWQRLAFAV